MHNLWTSCGRNQVRDTLRSRRVSLVRLGVSLVRLRGDELEPSHRRRSRRRDERGGTAVVSVVCGAGDPQRISDRGRGGFAGRQQVRSDQPHGRWGVGAEGLGHGSELRRGQRHVRSGLISGIAGHLGARAAAYPVYGAGMTLSSRRRCATRVRAAASSVAVGVSASPIRLRAPRRDHLRGARSFGAGSAAFSRQIRPGPSRDLPPRRHPDRPLPDPRRTRPR